MNEDCNMKDLRKIYWCDYINYSPWNGPFKSTDIVGEEKPVIDILNHLKVCFICMFWLLLFALPAPFPEKKKKV